MHLGRSASAGITKRRKRSSFVNPAKHRMGKGAPSFKYPQTMRLSAVQLPPPLANERTMDEDLPVTCYNFVTGR
jgi:hypothetical protein